MVFLRIIETVSETTFRNIIVRSGERDNVSISNINKIETVQQGQLPTPSYGSTLVRVPERDCSGSKAALKIGGAVLSNRGLSDLEFLFTGKKMWQEESTAEVHILMYCLDKKHFEWTQLTVDGLEARAFHSAILVDRFVYIFGGLEVKTNRRFPILPMRLNVNDWTISHVVCDVMGGFLSGAAALPCADKVFIVGGYQEEVAGAGDKPCDIISEITFSTQGNQSYNFHLAFVKLHIILYCQIFNLLHSNVNSHILPCY